MARSRCPSWVVGTWVFLTARRFLGPCCIEAQVCSNYRGFYDYFDSRRRGALSKEVLYLLSAFAVDFVLIRQVFSKFALRPIGLSGIAKAFVPEGLGEGGSRCCHSLGEFGRSAWVFCSVEK